MKNKQKELFKNYWELGGKKGYRKTWSEIKVLKWAEGIRYDDVQDWIREFGGSPVRTGIRPNLEVNENGINNDIRNNELLLKKIERGLKIEELKDFYKEPENIILSRIEDLKNNGYNVVELDNKYFLEKIAIPSENIIENKWEGEQIIKFGVVSDNHLCNKKQQLTFLNQLYNRFQKAEVEKVYNCGDLTDGYYKNRPEHIYELFRHGADEQVEYIIGKYPQRNGIITEFITGNHDDTHLKNGGVNIGRMIAKERKDMVYLGCSKALINLTPNCKLKIHHPDGGTAYALSYNLQKRIEAFKEGEKPNILITGHFHKLLYLFVRNVHCLEAGTTCAQTDWMDNKRISAHIGGWLVTIHVDNNGTITRFLPELIPQYQTIEKDY